MQLIRHDEDSPWQDWRPGVRTRLWSGAMFGATQLHVGEQLVQPGTGAPYHWHPYEEHLTVYRGVADVMIGETTVRVEGPASVIIPPRSFHGFTNVGEEVLHIIGASPWPIHQTSIPDDEAVWVGWEPGTDFRRRRLVERGKAT